VRIFIILNTLLVLETPLLASESYKRDVTLCSIGISHTERAKIVLLDKLLVAIF